MLRIFKSVKKKLDTETTFLLYEKDERNSTIEQQRKNIQEQLEKGSLIFVLKDKKTSRFRLGKYFYCKQKKILHEFSNSNSTRIHR